MAKTRCGYVAIVGRPNVGKSTLLNYILGQKISITSRKPQTTRHKVLGIKTESDTQIIFVDTPGLHKQADKAINRYMNRAASSALQDVDVVLFVVDRTVWTEEDDFVVQHFENVQCPVILVVNKIDLLNDKTDLLPYLKSAGETRKYSDIIPLSALNRHNLHELETCIEVKLPEAVHLFPNDQITDRSQRFMVAELVREKIMRQLGDELPYSITVEIEDFSLQGKVIHISALIYVERDGQKRIIIGDKGSRIRSIGTEARLEMETLLDCKVMLRLWVKVKSGWSDDERALRSLGYDDN
jgi:GTP-binding protein Era